MLLTILSFIIVMGVIVFVHELGHLIAAKRNHIIVEEFGLGYPPRVLKLFERDGTIYSLNAIPFGGFARMRGEDDPTDAGSFAAATRGARAITLLAGPAMNFLLAILLFAVLTALQGITDPNAPATVVADVMADSAAADAGIHPGDRFVAADGVPLNSNTDITQYTQSHPNQPVVYTLVRGEERGQGGQTIQLTITPRPNEAGLGRLGIALVAPRRAATPGEVVISGFTSTWDVVYMTFAIPATLIRTGQPLSDAGFMGPVGIAVTTGGVVRAAQTQGSALIVIEFIALLSAALGLTNLLPLPALDGGRLLFIAIEALRRRRIEPQREGLVHLIGFGLLLMLVTLLSIREITALINGTFPVLEIR